MLFMMTLYIELVCDNLESTSESCDYCGVFNCLTLHYVTELSQIHSVACWQYSRTQLGLYNAIDNQRVMLAGNMYI